MKKKYKDSHTKKKMSEIEFELGFIKRELYIAIRLLKNNNKESALKKFEIIYDML